ncbi:MAG: hypothetical protein ACK5DD_08475 [Cyclobacteriaceae bacterium]|jgi:hypothetical protein
MKKLLSIIAIALICATTFTACSDEDVKPNNGGGTVENKIVR